MAECLRFIIGQLQLNNLLHAALRQHRGNASRRAGYAIFPVKNARHRQRAMAAGENIAADFGDGSGDAVLRAAFAGVNLKPQLAHLFGNQLPVESLAGMFLVNIGDGGAVNRRV